MTDEGMESVPLLLSNIQSRRRIRKACVFTPRLNGHWGLVMAEEGDIGSAKSVTWAQDAARWGFNFFDMRSYYPAEEYLGIPVFNEDKTRFHYAAPPFVAECQENPYTILLFDDWTAATSAKVFGAQLELMLEHRVGGHELPDPTRIFAVYNPAKQAPGGRQPSMANANRVGHRNAGGPSPQELAEYFMSSGQKIGKTKDTVEQELDPREEEKRVMAAWPEAISWASGIMAGAVVAHTELVSNIPETVDPNASKAFPTCRTTDFARLALAASRIHDLTEEERSHLIGAFVGEGAAAVLHAYIKEAEVDPLAYLDGGKVFEYTEGRYDTMIALINACTSFVVHDVSDKRIARAKVLWGILENVAETAADNVEPAFNVLKKAELTGMAEAREVFKKLAPVFRATNYHEHRRRSA